MMQYQSSMYNITANPINSCFDNNSITYMFETTSDLSVKDNKSQAPPLNNQQFSLPLIPKKPASRGQLTSRKQIIPKQKLTLPNINNNSEINIQSPQSTDRDKQNLHFLNKSAFAKDVKEKLNFVLGQMPQADNLEQDQDHQSNDSDFQAKINQNKEIIKQHRLKKDGGENINLSQGNQQPSQQKKTKKGVKARNQSLYEKRVKEYRDQSIQNKYLQKRKQTVKQKISNNPLNPNSVRQSLKDIKPRDEYGLGKMDRNDIHKSVSKKNYQRAISYKSSQKNLNEINKSVNLFDGIQNYLQNPRESKKQQSHQLVGLTLLKAKRDLEDKIKDLNQKLGTVEKQEERKKQPMEMEKSGKEWRRVEIKNQKIDCQNSNFDKQLQRISSLQQKNSLCLEKYLEHQKILLQLELRRKQLPRKLHVNSH